MSKEGDSRRKRLVAAAVAMVGAILLMAGPMVAQGQEPPGGGDLTCGWCVYSVREIIIDENTVIQDPGHEFPNGGDACGWPVPSGASCQRCGSTSMPCHGWEPGDCSDHPDCGSEELAMARDAIEEMVQHGDGTALAAFVDRGADKLSIRYVASGGRIVVRANCDRHGNVVQFAIPVALREDLDRVLAE